MRLLYPSPTTHAAQPTLIASTHHSNPDTIPSGGHFADKLIRTLPKHAMCPPLELPTHTHFYPTVLASTILPAIISNVPKNTLASTLRETSNLALRTLSVLPYPCSFANFRVDETSIITEVPTAFISSATKANIPAMNFRTPKIAVAPPSHSDITLDVATPLLQPSFQRSNPNTTPSDRHLADKQIRNLPKQAMCLTLEPSMGQLSYKRHQNNLISAFCFIVRKRSQFWLRKSAFSTQEQA